MRNVSRHPVSWNVGETSQPALRGAAVVGTACAVCACPSRVLRRSSNPSPNSRPSFPFSTTVRFSRVFAAMRFTNPGTSVALLGRNVHSSSSALRRSASAAAASLFRRSRNSTPRAYIPSGPLRAPAGSPRSFSWTITRLAFPILGVNVHSFLFRANSASSKVRMERTYESPGFLGRPVLVSRKKCDGSIVFASGFTVVLSPPPACSSFSVRRAFSRNVSVPFCSRYSTRSKPPFSRAWTLLPILFDFWLILGAKVSSGSFSPGLFSFSK
mmetsp:Transcript_5227/g.19556  ORF Transcript_5227/g.19556 Transcript_5227/m.19556 type:complete len:270 (-) Transcript_5227:5015-5824(-)